MILTQQQVSEPLTPALPTVTDLASIAAKLYVDGPLLRRKWNIISPKIPPKQ